MPTPRTPPERIPSETPQLDLLGGTHTTPAEIHRLFIALMPDAATCDQFARVADALKVSHPALRARWIRAARYHATLHFLGDQPMLRLDSVDAAKAAIDTIRCAPFTWTLDYAFSFHGRQPPCVLRGTQMPEPLQRLWEDLRRALTLAGQGGHIERHFTPHVTLAYSRSVMLDNVPIEPVTWQVDTLALIHSVVGQPDYHFLGRWPLVAE
ncbi:MAG: RNA 2',3'-cyclic phosphodiesterase [Rhodanobacter sp.]